jgi:hypothetical protein
VERTRRRSRLRNALLALGLQPGLVMAAHARAPGISYVVLDDRGVADTAVGQMISPDMMRSRSKCVAAPGNCERAA